MTGSALCHEDEHRDREQQQEESSYFFSAQDLQEARLMEANFKQLLESPTECHPYQPIEKLEEARQNFTDHEADNNDFSIDAELALDLKSELNKEQQQQACLVMVSSDGETGLPVFGPDPRPQGGACSRWFTAIQLRLSNMIDGMVIPAKLSILLAARYLRWYANYLRLNVNKNKKNNDKTSVLSILRSNYALNDWKLARLHCSLDPNQEECSSFAYVINVLSSTIDSLEEQMSVLKRLAPSGESQSNEEENLKQSQHQIPLLDEVDIRNSMDRLRSVMIKETKKRIRREAQVLASMTIQAAVFWALSSTMTSVFAANPVVEESFSNVAKLLIQTDLHLTPNYISNMPTRILTHAFQNFISPPITIGAPARAASDEQDK